MAEYLNRVRETHEEVDRNVSLLQIGSKPFYIEQDVIDKELEKYEKNERKQAKRLKSINVHKDIFENQVTLVEASAGMGKSKLLRNLVSYFSNPSRFLEDKVIPVYVTYAAFVSKFDRKLADVVSSSIGQEALNALAAETKILILIDGMDEKNESPEEQKKTVEKLVEAAKGNSSFYIIATTRYLSVPQEADYSSKKIRLLEIRDLSMGRIVEFLQKLCVHNNLPNRIVEDLKKSPLFKELPKSPIAAILLGRLLRDNQKDIPSNMTELYAQYVEIILGRWDIDKGLQTQKEYEALDSILTEIAVYFVENELAYLSIDEATTYFVKYLERRNLGITPTALFQKMVDRCEIVFVDVERNRLAFKHRTFAEFLFAKKLVKTGKVRISNKALEVYWMNSFFFMAGLMRDCPDVINQYIALKPENEFQQWIKLVNAGSMMLAGFATEYNHIEAGIRCIYEEAAKLYKSALDGKVDLEMAKFERMTAIQLLGFCQFLMKEHYSFDFFQKAIETAAYAIEADDSTAEYRPYALFFLFTTSLALGKPEVADLVIKALGADVPLAVRLGLHLEGKTIKEKTKALKKFDHHTVDILRTSKKSNHQAHLLFEIPLVKSSVKKIEVKKK